MMSLQVCVSSVVSCDVIAGLVCDACDVIAGLVCDVM